MISRKCGIGKTDGQLIQRFLGGDRESVGMLVERYERKLYFLCMRIVGNHEDALEMVQKTFIQVIEKAGSLQKSSSFSTWMYRIAINLCYNFLRERKVYAQALSGLSSLNEGRFYDSMEREEERSMVQESLKSLSEKQRLTIILKVYQNLSYQEIAEILGCQEVTVRSHFHLGLKKLAIKLKHYGEDFYEM